MLAEFKLLEMQLGFKEKQGPAVRSFSPARALPAGTCHFGVAEGRLVVIDGCLRRGAGGLLEAGRTGAFGGGRGSEAAGLLKLVRGRHGAGYEPCQTPPHLLKNVYESA